MARKAWNIPEIWPGETAFIIGGGPSLPADLSCLHNKRAIAVNQAFRLGNWINIAYFGDCAFYSENFDDIRKFPGLLISSCQREGWWPNVRRLRRTKPYGIESQSRDAISWNNNSGASAINIAFWFGCKRIILISFDMKADKNRHNWHDRYPKRATNWAKKTYPRHLKCFSYIAADAKALGVEILNATPGSAIQDFPYIELSEACKL